MGRLIPLYLRNLQSKMPMSILNLVISQQLYNKNLNLCLRLTFLNSLREEVLSQNKIFYQQDKELKKLFLTKNVFKEKNKGL